jgi:hypothetical protein
MMIYFRKKTHDQFQSQFGPKNAKLEQLSSLCSKSRLQILAFRAFYRHLSANPKGPHELKQAQTNIYITLMI